MAYVFPYKNKLNRPYCPFYERLVLTSVSVQSPLMANNSENHFQNSFHLIKFANIKHLQTHIQLYGADL